MSPVLNVRNISTAHMLSDLMLKLYLLKLMSRLLIFKSRLLSLKSYLLILKSHVLTLKSYLLILKSRLLILKSYLLIFKSRLLILKSYLLILKSHLLTLKSYLLILKSHLLAFKSNWLPVFLSISSLMPVITVALPEDSKQPMNIVSDSTLFNYKTGQDIYEGNVKVDQGTSHLTADRLITQKNNQHKIISAIAYGIKTVAIYTTIPKQGDLVMHAEAKKISFYPPTSTVVFENDVTVTQGENNFHGQHIIYNMQDQIVAAPASKNGRSTIVIESNQLE
jgi:lipopolysaccharide export system protein LptA